MIGLLRQVYAPLVEVVATVEAGDPLVPEKDKAFIGVRAGGAVEPWRCERRETGQIGRVVALVARSVGGPLRLSSAGLPFCEFDFTVAEKYEVEKSQA